MPNLQDPLNRLLYRLLQKTFGSVQYSNEGQAMVSRYVRDPFDKDREILRIENPGEYYQVCCPRCNDTRHRLYINHRWGVRDSRNRRNLWLCVCYNENCYQTDMARDELLEMVTAQGASPITRARISEGKIVREAGESQLPGPCYRLDRLPAAHPANRYLAGRFYEPERLGKFYGVSYCPQSWYMLAKNRIIYPIIYCGKLRGWQARYIGELDWKSKTESIPPKWWTDPAMRKSMVLANFDNARKYQTGVVVEGPGDIWGFGPMAVGTLGSSMSTHQIKDCVKAFGSGSLVMLWDPDVKKDPAKHKHFKKVMAQLDGKFRRGVAVVWLPDGTDPGNLDRAFMRRYVEREAHAQGVEISWKFKETT